MIEKKNRQTNKSTSKQTVQQRFDQRSRYHIGIADVDFFACKFIRNTNI